MLKMMGIVLIMGSFGGVAVSQRRQLRRRVTALDDMLAMLDYLSGELSYRLTDLPTLIERFSQDSRGGVAGIFAPMRRLLEQDDGLSLSFKWMKAFREHGEEAGMRGEDVSILCDLSDFIGRYDVQSQQRSIAYARERLTRQRALAAAELKSRGSVTRACCLAAGILLVLVLI